MSTKLRSITIALTAVAKSALANTTNEKLYRHGQLVTAIGLSPISVRDAGNMKIEVNSEAERVCLLSALSDQYRAFKVFPSPRTDELAETTLSLLNRVLELGKIE